MPSGCARSGRPRPQRQQLQDRTTLQDHILRHPHSSNSHSRNSSNYINNLFYTTWWVLARCHSCSRFRRLQQHNKRSRFQRELRRATFVVRRKKLDRSGWQRTQSVCARNDRLRSRLP
uniref:(northern house mosquito) hypothetical protein n=1 Tax=Culex pipiens TaxID=7175 RepID=A0A8D8FYU7_CULPI